MNKPQTKYATISWTPADVQSLAPSLSDEEAENWLSENQGYIQDRLIELGWSVIEDLLRGDDISLEEVSDIPSEETDV